MVKFICLSVQRTGTTSVGSFFEQLGLQRRGWETSRELKWGLRWYAGDLDAILNSPEFETGEIFEDFPWFAPDLYKIAHHRYPEARFVHFTRNEDQWLKSVLRFRDGMDIGSTKRHSALYQREREFHWARNHYDWFNENSNTQFSLFDKAEHYKAWYRLYNREVQDFFKDKDPNLYFHGTLEDPDKWKKLGDWCGLSVPDGLEVHKHRWDKEIRLPTPKE